MTEQLSLFRQWQKGFLFCSGIAVATAFCMKWMEADLVQNGKVFTILGLELTYPREKIEAILAGLEPGVKGILRYHLSFDFMFMVGVFPGVAALLMMGRQKTSSSTIKKWLGWLAILQLLAWGCDITENIWLLTWLKNEMVDHLQAFRTIVIVKWIIVIVGIVFGIIYSIKKK